MAELYCSLLYHILNKVVPNINMLGVVLKHGILRKTNPILVVALAIDHSGIQHMSKQLIEELRQPDSFTEGHNTRIQVVLFLSSRQLKSTTI